MTYLKDIVYTAFICGIITTISAISKNGTGKYVKFICALVFITSILAPFINKATVDIKLFDDLYGISSDSFSDKFPQHESSALNIIEKEICDIAKKEAADNFSCNTSDFIIELNIKDIANGELKINDTIVYVSGEAKVNSAETIKKYFDKILNCDTEVIITE